MKRLKGIGNGGSVVVDSLFIFATYVVGFSVWALLYYVRLSVLSSFEIISWRKRGERAGCFILIGFLLSCGC